jgi:hypothetical protein
MKNYKNIEQQIEEALNSADGIKKASPKPYLLTRINARLNNDPAKSTWENVAAFISKPSVMVLGLCLVVGINMSVITLDGFSQNNTANDRQVSSFADEDFYPATFATIDNFENP